MNYKDKLQVSVYIPIEWKTELERIAWRRSIENDETVTYLDLIREEIEKLVKLSGSLKND